MLLELSNVTPLRMLLCYKIAIHCSNFYASEKIGCPSFLATLTIARVKVDRLD